MLSSSKIAYADYPLDGSEEAGSIVTEIIKSFTVFNHSVTLQARTEQMDRRTDRLVTAMRNVAMTVTRHNDENNTTPTF